VNTTFLDNTVETWLIALAIATGGSIVLRLVHGLLLRQLTRLSKRTATPVDDLLVAVLRATRRLFIVGLPLLLALEVLTLPSTMGRIVSVLTTVLWWLQIAIWLTAGVREWAANLVRRRGADMSSATTLAVLRVGILVLVWTIVLLALLDNVGVNISALVAGLGIGGVALALAVQGIFADLVASLVIVLDKPFVIGDFVVVGELAGTVENIGLKTTRIRSISGEEIVCSHSDLLASRIRNYKRMQQRRILFTFGVTYASTRAQLEAVPAAIRAIVEAQDQTRFDRCHLVSFGDSSIDFEVVYFVLDADYAVHVAKQHAINLALVSMVAELGLDFAFPTRTIHLVPEAAPTPLSSPSAPLEGTS